MFLLFLFLLKVLVLVPNLLLVKSLEDLIPNLKPNPKPNLDPNLEPNLEPKPNTIS